ncbi:alpha-L-fucosidase [Novipirellula artificiosorum]|uniref:alpha-L-fucosidase n=1 Tax=Novipirellula artificiosorum TaxID=2528016 RepID=A0A5C6D534_9BACT|nr:alpha-L-fucosidase [Novipirellula artificiosorum]TWU32052.1 Alpha-L-fucosidase [Novipirellula artificiosorum]
MKNALLFPNFLALMMLAMSPLPAEDKPAVESGPIQKQPWLQPDADAILKWQQMRFGMFIHWGPVSLTGHEIGWSRGRETTIDEYDNLYKKFDPENFDADRWVSIAKAAGMKYIVLTTKHHDGFCLWDTKQTDFNIMNSAMSRDVTKEIAEACQRQGIAFGTYHSVCDWHHPDFPRNSPGGKVRREKSDIQSYRRYLRAQVKELIENYGPLVTMWFDVPQEFDADEGSENIRICRELQSDIVVNNRAGGGLGDYATPEQRVGGFDIDQPWETCMTICRQWAWKPDDKMKSLAECLQTLIRTAGGDGNLLFNVGPMPNGEIEARQVDRLQQMGDWLAEYGETIYATRGGPYKPTKHLVSTRKGNTVYLHILSWPDEVIRVPNLPATLLNHHVITGGSIVLTTVDDEIEIRIPQSDRQEIDTIVAIELDQPAIELAPISVSYVGQSLTEGRQATASNVFQRSAQYAAAKAVDADNSTRWATDAETKECSLEVDLGKPERFDRAVLDECVEYGVRVHSFELQYRDGEDWKTFFQGTTIGRGLSVNFDPVTARHVRLRIHGDDGPTINEFQLFTPKRTKP